MSSGKCKLKQWDTTTYLLEWAISGTLTIPNAGEDMEQQEFSIPVGENAKWYNHSGRQFLKKLNLLCPYDPENALLGIYPKVLKTYVHTKSCTRMFIAALFIIAKTWKQPRCLSVGECKNKLWYIHAMELKYSVLKRNKLSSPEKTWKKLKCILLN